MKISKGLGFPVVALPGVGYMYMPAKGEDEQEAARVFLCGGDVLNCDVGDFGGWPKSSNALENL